MSKKTEYWEIPTTSKQKENLDEELINELNEKFQDEGGYLSKRSSRGIYFRVVGFLTAIIFIVIIFGSWFKILNLPSLDFLSSSKELALNPEIQQLQEGVVVINAENRRGTGFNIDKEGLVITNHHIIDGSRRVMVTFSSGEVKISQTYTSFPEVDLAIIDIDGQNLPVLELEIENNILDEEQVVVIGNPLGFSRVVDEGVVIGKINLRGWDEPVIMIQGSAIYKGSSGSPVFNVDGRVVAVIFATLSAEGTDEIIGLAVPIYSLLGKLD